MEYERKGTGGNGEQVNDARSLPAIIFKALMPQGEPGKGSGILMLGEYQDGGVGGWGIVTQH